MKQRKINNPRITDFKEEKKVFDSLDGLIEEAESKPIEAEKNKDIRNKESLHLLKNVLGSNLYVEDGYDVNKIKLQNYDTDLASKLFLNLYDKKRKWFGENKPCLKIEANIHESPVSIALLAHNDFVPLQITAYTPKALERARVFASAYEKHTGKKVVVNQKCSSVKLEEAEYLKSASQVIGEDLKRIVGIAISEGPQQFAKGVFHGVTTPFSVIRSGINLKTALDIKLGKPGAFSRPIPHMMIGIVSSITAIGYVADEARVGNYLPLAVLCATNLLDVGCVYGKSVRKRMKK